MSGGGVTGDGSPVWAYLALPPGDAPDIIHAEVRAEGSILELGCGAGRVTRPLVAYGHSVVAVDDSPEMLEHVTGAEKIQADLYALDLDRRFDAVVAASHLIDSPDREVRLALLRVCRRHVTDDGVVIVQRHEPDWAHDPGDSDGFSGPVGLKFQLIEHRGTEFDGSVTYWLGGRVQTQTFTVGIVEDELLAREAAECGLALDGWLDQRKAWAKLSPAPGSDPR